MIVFPAVRVPTEVVLKKDLYFHFSPVLVILRGSQRCFSYHFSTWSQVIHLNDFRLHFVHCPLKFAEFSSISISGIPVPFITEKLVNILHHDVKPVNLYV